MNEFSKKILLVCILCVPFLAQAQTRTLVFGGTGMHEGLGATIELPSGDFISVGTQHSANANDITDLAIYRISRTTGQVIWTRSWGTTANDIPNDAIFQNGEVIVCGESFNQSNSNLDAYVLKLDTLGNVLAHLPFGVTFRSESFYALDGTPDGGVALTGFITGVSNSNDTWTVKLDAQGVKLWEKTDGTSRIEVGMGVATLPDGSVVVSGDKQKIDLTYNAYCIKYNADGRLAWRSFISNFQNGGCKSIIYTRDNELVVAGEMSTPASTFFDVYLVKLDTMGQVLWQTTIPGWVASTDAGMDIVQKANGNYAIAGFGGNPNQNGDLDALLMLTDTSGAVLRTDFLGTAGDIEVIGRVIQSQYGGLVLTGSSDGPNGSLNLLIFDSLQPVISGISNNEFSTKAFSVFPTMLFGLGSFTTSLPLDGLECFDQLGRRIRLQKTSETTWQIAENVPFGKYFLRGTRDGITHVSAIIVTEVR